MQNVMMIVPDQDRLSKSLTGRQFRIIAAFVDFVNDFGENKFLSKQNFSCVTA